MQNFLRGKGLLPCITQKSFRLKKGLKFDTLAHQCRLFLRKGPFNPQSYTQTLRLIGPETGHFQVTKCEIFIGKAGHKINLD